MPITLADASAILAKLPITEALAKALDIAAQRLATAVRNELAAAPGGSHLTPWRETGALEDSVQHSVQGLNAIIGSNDSAAAPQEVGTIHVAPRPFLGPAAAALAEDLAQDIGAAVAAVIARGHA